ncbi:MAG: protein kinase [Anaerolineae bacterium]|nr:protein kinase [Anaerolineae bacterium]
MKPTVLNDRYRLTELVGAGGMATVYRGEDLLLDRPVAVKFLREPYASDAEARDRFVHEARAAAKLDHPNIVLVMELVHGQDLKSLIRKDAPLPVVQAVRLAQAIAAGVAAAHRMSIVHCDLKPQNILVTEDGQVKVADFGIARALAPDDHDSEPVEVVWGSPHYLSPEQARGYRPTPASDVYSIGVMLYEMLTGVPPFHDADPEVLAMKHCREEPAPLAALNPRVPSGLDWLVRKILSKEPAQRYRNGDQLGMALDQYLRHGEDGTGPFLPIESAGAVAGSSPAVAPAGVSRERVSSAPRSAMAAPMPSAAASQSDQGLGTQPIAPQRVPDTTVWMLMLVAAIAVIGLVPLWAFVYRTYTAAAPRVTPIAETPGAQETPGGEVRSVTVPNLTGLGVADAQRLAQSMELDIEVLGEQESTDTRPGAVLEQTPGAGVRVPAGSVVSVLVAAGRALQLPDVTGYDLEAVQDGLENEGLMLSISEVRSTEERGTILGQEPLAGATVRVGDTISLTVSGGANIPILLGVSLNQQVLLEQAWISDFDYSPGGAVPVTLRWRCLAPLGVSYKVFVHVLTGDMQTLVAQQDTIPLNGLRPTTSWVPNEIINDPHQVVLPTGTPAGTYQIRVGLYSDAGRLPVSDAGGAQVTDDTIFVTTISVR